MLTSSSATNVASSVPFDYHAPRSPQTSKPLDYRAGARHGTWTVAEAGRLYDRPAAGPIAPVVEISPPDLVKRRTARWDGLAAEVVQSPTNDRFHYRFRAPMHLLVVYEQGVRRDGETVVEGVPRSTLRDLARKLIFVPAGHDYHEWQEPRTLMRAMYFYLDPAKLQSDSELDEAGISFAPRLFFQDATLWDSALKLMRSVESPTSEDRLYGEALGVVLMHELILFNRGKPRVESQVRGGLAGWQQRTVTTYIEDHLAEQIPLATLAGLVRLSPYYFCRAFKQSFGIPPHRYHTSRRIERAKALLAKRERSVTEIGLTVGFSEASSFTTAFRKTTGLTPSGYHRSLG
jgi:AraC family transcriptional regulator